MSVECAWYAHGYHASTPQCTLAVLYAFPSEGGFGGGLLFCSLLNQANAGGFKIGGPCSHPDGGGRAGGGWAGGEGDLKGTLRAAMFSVSILL